MDDVLTKIQVLVLPTVEVLHPMGGLTDGTEFWVRTDGMAKLDLPEIEMVNVPILWLGPAIERIQRIAEFSAIHKIDNHEIREGDTTFHLSLMVVKSPDELGFWADQGLEAVRITMGVLDDPFDQGPSDPEMLN